MAIRLGSAVINKLMLGSTELKKAYHGTTLIHDKTGGGPPPWTPADITTYAWYGSRPAHLWQDTAGTTAVTADSQLVRRRDDLSGNGRHALMSTDDRRTVYRTDGTHHWLEYDGADDGFTFSGTGWLRNIAGFTCVAGVRVASAGSNTKTLISTITTGATKFGLQNQSGGAQMRLIVSRTDASGAGNISANLSFDADQIHTAHADFAGTGGYSIQVDNNTAVTGTIPGTVGNSQDVDATGGCGLGGFGGSTGNPFRGRDYGIVVTPLLSGDDLANLKTWMAMESGVTL